MILRKMFYLLTAASLLTFAVGCDKSTDENNAPELTLNTPTNGQAVTGSSFTVSGNASDDNAINDITYQILSGTTAVYTGHPSVAYEGKAKVDFSDPISVSAIGNGEYKFVLTVSDKDGKSASAQRAITVSGGVSITTSGTLTVGAQDAAAGSYLDVDAGTVYTSASLAANVGKVDVVVGYIQADSKIYFMSQATAKTSGFNANLSATDHATIKATALSLSDYNGLNFSTLKGTFDNAAGSGAEKVEIQANKAYAIKTNNSATASYAVLYVTSVTASTTGSAVLTVKFKQINL